MITEAGALGNCAAGRKYGVPENNLRRWRKEREALFACAATQKAFWGPQKGVFPEVEASLSDFVKETRSRDLAVIADAWAAIPEGMVAASFKKCCIANSLDGTEDSELWECDSNKESTDASGDDSS